MRPILLLPLLSLAFAHMERRSQPGALQPTPIELRPLEWGDVNFIATTDTHGWLPGHPNDPQYSADFGDFASFVSHMRDQATHRHRDLFVVDSGDLHHGTGMTDATKPAGKMYDPIFEKVHYDLLAPGNHELYTDELVNTMYKIYAPRWGNRYLTSNVYFKDVHTNKTVPLGKQYTTFRGKYGTKVLAYGFIFNYQGPSNNSVVEFSTVTVQKPWFQQSLKEESDIIVVMGHTPIRFPETKVVVDAIRKAHPSKPILVFGGHNHIRDFIQYDARAAGLSAGRYMETVGWMSVEGIRDPACNTKDESVCIGKNLTFHRRYLDTNRHTYKFHSLSHPKQKFDTWRGGKITREITYVRQKLHLFKVLGKAPQDYFMSRVPFSHPQNLYKLLQDEVLETVLLPSRANPGLVVIPTGSHRYDIQKGDFTVDDAYVACPYPFNFIYLTVKASQAKRVVDIMNNITVPTGGGNNAKVFSVHWISHPFAPSKRGAELTPGYVTKDDYGTGGDDWPHSPIPVYNDAPLYVANKLATSVQDQDTIDLVFVDYYAKPVLKALRDLEPNGTFTPESYREDIDMAGMWMNFAKLKW